METLLAKYRANPTTERLAAVMAYSRKHPFAECLLKPEDAALYYRLCNYPTKA